MGNWEGTGLLTHAILSRIECDSYMYLDGLASHGNSLKKGIRNGGQFAFFFFKHRLLYPRATKKKTTFSVFCALYHRREHRAEGEREKREIQILNHHHKKAGYIANVSLTSYEVRFLFNPSPESISTILILHAVRETPAAMVMHRTK